MANLLHIKGSRNKILNSFPNNRFGDDGDIVIVKVQGKGVYLCLKSNGTWYVSNKLEQLRKLEKTSIKDLKVERLKSKNTTLTQNEIDVSTGDFTLDVAGDIALDADGGDVIIKDGGNAFAHFKCNTLGAGNSYLTLFENAGGTDAFSIRCTEHGATTITTSDLSAAAANLTIDPDGELILTPVTEVKSDAPLKIKEAANAVADTAAYGQLWVKTATPNELYFTTDAGDDIQLTSGTATAFVGDITGVTAGDGLTGGGTSGAVSLAVGVDDSTIEIDSDALRVKSNGITLGTHTTGNYVATLTAGALIDLQNNSGETASPTIDVDLTEAAEAAIADGDYILFLDGGATGSHAKESLADLATLFAGTNLTASSSVIGVDDAFIVNDAADIMAVSDFGANAALKIDADQPATAGAEDSVGLWIDYDRIVAGSGTAAHNDIGIDLDVNAASLGTSSVRGMDIDVVGATSGTHTAIGIDLDVDSADTNIGMIINTAGTHLKLVANADTNDYATFTLADTGDLTIATVGDGTTDSDLTLDVDGDILMDAAGGDVAITSANVKIDSTKKLYFDGGSGNTYILESSADALQFWAGGDNVLTMIETAVGNIINFNNSAAGFTQFEPTYNSSDTNVTFQDNGNKAFCTFGSGNITDMNLYFPNASGNFVLLLKQDASGSRTVTNWKTFDQADGSESTVVWSGGSNPTLTTTANKLDILSFYWDNDNHKAYGVASLNF